MVLVHWISFFGEKFLYPYFMPYQKKKILKWIIDLDIRAKTTALLEENVGDLR